MELSLADNVYNTEVSVENRLEHGFCYRKHVFPLKMTFCTLFSLLQRNTRFEAHIVQNRKLTLFSWGNFDQTTRISAKVRYKQVFSIKLSYFLEFSSNDRI